MRYLKKFNEEKSIFKNNINIHHTNIEKICEVNLPDPQHGNFRLNVFPFENTGEYVSLPDGFKVWEKAFNDVLSKIPLQEGANTHYVTINSEFFTNDDFLRREGVHMDGNFCVDPLFSSVNERKGWGGTSPSTWGGTRFKIEDEETVSRKGWGGTSPAPSTWGGTRFKGDGESILVGSEEQEEELFYENLQHLVKEDNSHVDMNWVLPYDISIPIAKYVSEKKGGILTVSTEVGCQGWEGTFKGEVLSEGSYENMSEQLTDDKKVIFEENKLYFMSSNTPHETLKIGKGKRRTFLRITLNHNYLNENITNNL